MVIDRLKKYLKHTLNIDAEILKWEHCAILPFFMTELYDFYRIKFAPIEAILMVERSSSDKTPGLIRKHIAQINEKFDGEVIFVSDNVTSFNRKLLVDQKIPFIIPDNQMYLPTLGIDFREYFRQTAVERNTVSPSTQALLLLFIYNKDITQLSVKESALKLNYSVMTMSRSFDELKRLNIGQHYKSGKERYMSFNEKGLELWEISKLLMTTPVKKRIQHYSSNKIDGKLAGVSALSSYSMIGEPNVPVYAAFEPKKVDELNQEYGIEVTFEYEVWSYNPELFSTNNTVDKLSLFLSLKDSTDERIQIALDEMMESIEW